MGKQLKRFMVGKKHRKKYKYTKHEFINICCDKCRICENGASPTLCYSEFYKKHPKDFIKITFKRLLELKHLMGSHLHHKDYHIPDVYLTYIFKEAFCKANLCNKSTDSVYKRCNNIHNCLEAFRRQMKGQPLTTFCTVSNKIKKKHERYVVQAYPSFFTNDSDVFRKEIKEILN